jgi:hypothetical protein
MELYNNIKPVRDDEEDEESEKEVEDDRIRAGDPEENQNIEVVPPSINEYEIVGQVRAGDPEENQNIEVVQPSINEYEMVAIEGGGGGGGGVEREEKDKGQFERAEEGMEKKDKCENPCGITINISDLVSSEAFANKLLEIEAPHSAHKLSGFGLSWLFILLVLGANSVMFALLFKYYLYDACVLNSVISEASPAAEVSYTTGTFKICSTYGRVDKFVDHHIHADFNIPCRLPGLSCSDYGSYYPAGCDTFNCTESIVCGNYSMNDVLFEIPPEDRLYGYGIGYSHSLSFSYLECLPVEVALTSSIQYIIFAQVAVLSFFFLVQACVKSNQGVLVLFKAKTWMNLYNNVKPIKTDD